MGRKRSSEPHEKRKPVNVRWMLRRDLPEVLAIERESFEDPWTRDQFVDSLRHRAVLGMVAEADEDRVVGFTVYALRPRDIHVWNFAVAADWRREGIGAAMIAKLARKLSAQRRTRITLEVRETNLPAQLFFQAQGFRAVRVLRGWYEDTDEDAYGMVYRVGSHEPATAGVK